LAWVMFYLANHDLETTCDEWVVRRMSVEQRAKYAFSLISMAQSTKRVVPISMFGKYAAKRSLKERIETIMKAKKSSFVRNFIAVFLVATLGFASLTVFASEAQNEYIGNECDLYLCLCDDAVDTCLEVIDFADMNEISLDLIPRVYRNSELTYSLEYGFELSTNIITSLERIGGFISDDDIARLMTGDYDFEIAMHFPTEYLEEEEGRIATFSSCGGHYRIASSTTRFWTNVSYVYEHGVRIGAVIRCIRHETRFQRNCSACGTQVWFVNQSGCGQMLFLPFS